MVTGGMARRGAAALVLLLGGCGDPPIFSPDAASISVTSLTSGDPIEADGYALIVDGGPARRLGTNSSIFISPLMSGDHTLELSGITPGCAVNGGNPRTVHTASGMTTQSMFIVGCSVPGTGRILVQTYTYGEGPGRYRLELNEEPSKQVGENDQTTFFAVPAGPAVLTLSGAPENCNVVPPNPRTLRVPDGIQLVSQFKIHCFN